MSISIKLEIQQIDPTVHKVKSEIGSKQERIHTFFSNLTKFEVAKLRNIYTEDFEMFQFNDLDKYMQMAQDM